MKSFTDKIADQITGTLSCFDRVIFKGHLKAISYPAGMEKLLFSRGLKIKDFAKFVQTQSDRLVLHAKTVAGKHGRPYQYLVRRIRKDEEARRIAREQNITRGLICVFSELETCPSFKIGYGLGRPCILPAPRKCLCLYYYFLHPNLGLIHVRIQSWFPFVVQIAVNGHEWLAIQMRRHQIAYEQLDNAFIKIACPHKAQRLADQFARLNWPALFQKIAAFVNPLLQNILSGQSYYWTTDQAEFATDIMFKNQAALAPLFRELIKHAFLCFGATDLLAFLGKKLTPNFTSEVITDFKTRAEGMRIKHRVGKNWIKMYDKFGVVLRVETVINYPYGFLTRRHGNRKGKRVIGWFPMTKGVTGLYRYAEIARSANSRYLQALAVVHDPRKAQELLCACTSRMTYNQRSYRGFNPAAQEDIAIFRALSAGQHSLHGFRNSAIRQVLFPTADASMQAKLSARVSRILKRFHVRGLIAKIPHSRRWRVTANGHALMSMAIKHHAEFYPAFLAA
jgi:hypothetical protein